MYFGSTASDLINPNNRPAPNIQLAQNTVQYNKLYEARVTRVGILETYEFSIYVYVFNVRETFLAANTISPDASALVGTGSYSPYFVGDKVYVSFLYGDASRPVIINRIYETEGAKEAIMLEGNPILPVGTTLPSGRVARPGPLASRQEAITNLGLLSIHTTPMLVI